MIMTKKMSLPVAKAGDPVSTAGTIEGPDRISVQERKYRAEDGARTLARAQEIKRDKGLMKDIKSHVKMMTKAICK